MKLKFRLVAGALIWLAWTASQMPLPLEAAWARMLLLFAPLVIVPVGLDLAALHLPEEGRRAYFLPLIKNWQLPSAALLCLAYSLPQGLSAGLLAIPWLLVTLLIAFLGFNRPYSDLGAPAHKPSKFIAFEKASCKKFRIKSNNLMKKEGRALPGLSISMGMVYLSVGGIWTVVDRMGIRPFAFDPEIVFLTVAHFHYAGFVLPIVAGLVILKIKNRWANMAVAGILSGVAWVAVGITASQFGGSREIESFAALWLALSAVLLAFFQVKLALRKNGNPMVSMFWAVAAVSLTGSMALAGLYGMRHVFPVSGLDIAMMRALHGSANVFGFGLFALLGWWLEFSGLVE